MSAAWTAAARWSERGRRINAEVPGPVLRSWPWRLPDGDTVLLRQRMDEGSLSAYLDSLRRLRALELDVICPGHGPYVRDPAAKLDEYIAHRLERERRIVAALGDCARTEDELLAAAWDVIPDGLRVAAAWTLAAHLDKLREEGRLPEGV